jgi:hypothetical protein
MVPPPAAAAEGTHRNALGEGGIEPARDACYEGVPPLFKLCTTFAMTSTSPLFPTLLAFLYEFYPFMQFLCSLCPLCSGHFYLEIMLRLYVYRQAAIHHEQLLV